jgi:hypothetical protein
MNNVIDLREKKFNVYELYKRGRLEESDASLKNIICSANIEGIDVEEMSSIDINSELFKNEIMLEFIDKNLNQEELIVGQVHVLNIFDDILNGDEDEDEKICFFSEFIDNICGIKSFLSIRMAAECCLCIADGDYDELKEVLRRTAIYTSQAIYGTSLRIRLEKVLKKYVHILALERPDRLEELDANTRDRLDLKQYVDMIIN